MSASFFDVPDDLNSSVRQRALEYAAVTNVPVAQEVARSSGAELASLLSPENFVLRWDSESGPTLLHQKMKLQIDFDHQPLDYFRKGLRGKNELICKALGVQKGVRSVLDLSVGLAVDSVMLVQLGFKVTGVERNPLLFCLLKEAFRKTSRSELHGYQLLRADALSYLKELSKSHQKPDVSKPGPSEKLFDAIYFDPMYPHKKKSALPKQEMVLFRSLVGDDGDASEVLKLALQCDVNRVVVKRPIHAEELLPGVSHSYIGKAVRFDTYVIKAISPQKVL